MINRPGPLWRHSLFGIGGPAKIGWQRTFLIVAAIVGISGVAVSLTGQSTPSPSGSVPQLDPAYKLVFADDFNTLDLSPDGLGVHTWYEGVWFNQKHAPHSNITVSSSILSLVWNTNQGSTDTSITTLSRDYQTVRDWRYGYFEARMRWNPVTGAWPAIWMIPIQDATGQAIYNGVKESGEIDIFEGQGDQPNTFFGTIHDWVNLHDTASKNNAFQLPAGTDFSQFHTYGLLWSPGTVTWYFDNQPLHSENTAAIFDKQDFFLILGMQEGANWKAGNLSGVTSSVMTMNVDWVRVWQKNRPAPPTNLGINVK